MKMQKESLWKKIMNHFHKNNTHVQHNTPNSDTTASTKTPKNMKPLLIIGLGNPTQQYENTRHNAGFLFLDFLANTLNATRFTKSNHTNALVADCHHNQRKIILAKPQDFMNASGVATQSLMQFYKLSTESDLIVVHDDLDIACGNFKVSKDRGAAGQNGVRDIIDKLQTKNFRRFRIGIEDRTEDQKIYVSGSDFVLGKFTQEQKSTLDKVFTDLTNELEKITK